MNFGANLSNPPFYHIHPQKISPFEIQQAHHHPNEQRLHPHQQRILYRSKQKYQAQPFQKRRSPSPSPIPHFSGKVTPKYNRIKPIIEDLISEQMSGNKQIQSALLGLRSLQQQLIQAANYKDHRNLKGRWDEDKERYWSEIERLIYKIIKNSNNESQQFRSRLQHLKNIKDRTLKEDLSYQQPTRQYSKDRRIQNRGRTRSKSKNLKSEGNQKGFLRPIQEQRLAGSNEERLLQQIRILKREKQQLAHRLHKEIQKNKILYYRVQQLQEEKVRYRSQTPQSSNQDLQHRLLILQKRLKQTNYENNNLRSQLKGLQNNRGLTQSNDIHQLQQQIKDLQNYVFASQRRANTYESMRSNQQSLQNEVQNLKLQNDSMRNNKHERSPSGDLKRLRQGLNQVKKEYMPRNVQSKYYKAGERDFEREY